MTDLSTQRRLASEVLKVGKSRVWLDPEFEDQLSEAITREDIRNLIDQKAIKETLAKGNSRGRAREQNRKRAYGHRSGHGSRKGRAGARQNRKKKWMSNIRSQRKLLRELREIGTIDPTQYRLVYRKATGGEFRSSQHLAAYVENNYGDN
jgi:large subunit ribosomal protein L19e